MYQNNEKVSTSQMVSIFILTIVGTGILTLPRSLAEAVGTDGWIVILLGGVITTALVYLMSYIVKKLPGMNFMEILTETVTKPVAYVLAGVFILYSLVLNSLLLRIFGEVIKMFLLLRTPIEVIMFSMLLTCIYLVRRGIETLGRLAELLLPIIILLNIPLFLLTIQGTNLSNLLPLFQTPVLDLIKAVPISFFSFLGFELILIFGVFYNKPELAPKSGVYTMIMVTLFYLFLNSMVLASFGTYQTRHLIWPTLSLFKTIEFPGLFIENVESVVMVVWVSIVFMSIAPFYLSKALLLAQISGLRNHNMFALPLLPIMYFISLYPDSMAATYEYLDIFTKYASTFIAIVVPILILMALLIRKGFGKEGKNA